MSQSVKPNVKATAFAPATVANVAVGFDLLGFAIEGAGDRVTVERRSDPGVVVENVEWETAGGGPRSDDVSIPLESARNTASVALESLIRSRKLEHGFRVSIRKGIAVGSGMGGSAASAVGAVVAANAVLDEPLSEDELLVHALKGEAAASGAEHADNVAPCLMGGLVAVISHNPPLIRRIRVPESVHCAVVRPALRIETRASRAGLKQQILLAQHVRQSACLAGFILGCERGDLELIRTSMLDLIIEPQRSGAIPGFDDAKKRAMAAGALGFSISGSGPAVFAWAEDRAIAGRVAAEVTAVFKRQGLECESWVSPLSPKGARV